MRRHGGVLSAAAAIKNGGPAAAAGRGGGGGGGGAHQQQILPPLRPRLFKQTVQKLYESPLDAATHLHRSQRGGPKKEPSSAEPYTMKKPGN